MAEKTYRKATEKEIKRGAKKTTDELSKDEALKYFRKRSEETGAKRFRWKGDVYDLDGNKIGGGKKAAPKKEDSKSSAPEKSPRPAPRVRAVADIETKSLVKGGRGDGYAEMARRNAKAAMERGVAKKATEKKDPIYYEEWKDMSRKERKETGLPVSTLGGAMNVPRGPVPERRGRNPVRMAKGGLVKANCGASMKPSGQRKK